MYVVPHFLHGKLISFLKPISKLVYCDCLIHSIYYSDNKPHRTFFICNIWQCIEATLLYVNSLIDIPFYILCNFSIVYCTLLAY